MALSDTSIRSIRPSDKVQKVSDGAGLYLHVTSTGSKLWRMAYRFDGKQKTLSFGSYPAVSLKEARARRDDAKVKIANGIDPGAEKKRVKLETATIEREQAMTFEVVAREWFERKTVNLTPGYRQQILSRLENHLFPFVGARPSTLEPADILGAVRHRGVRGALRWTTGLFSFPGRCAGTLIRGIYEI